MKVFLWVIALAGVGLIGFWAGQMDGSEFELSRLVAVKSGEAKYGQASYRASVYLVVRFSMNRDSETFRCEPPGRALAIVSIRRCSDKASY